MAPHVVIESVVKRYPDAPAPAVDGVSLEIAAGEFFALLGGPRAAARPRCCGCSPASRGRTPAAS